MAYKYNMPIIPFVVTYRHRTGIYRLLGPKNEPLVHVTIGEPIFPEKSQPRAAETERLRQVTHETMCRMAGIVQNTWPVKPDVE
jgi:1-acyl-sn-glycerol-3-phosphate acyltransferase